MRPQVLSYLLIAVTTEAWLSTRKDQKVRWWLVPLAWLWAMVHGMWPVGIIIGIVAVVGIALDRAVPPRTWLRLAAIPALSVVVTALTPVGPALFSAVLEVNSRGQYFSEWHSPDFREPNGIALLVLIGVMLIRLGRKHTAMSWTELAADGSGRGLGALHPADGERRCHDARPAGGQRPPVCSSRAAAGAPLGSSQHRGRRRRLPDRACGARPSNR